MNNYINFVTSATKSDHVDASSVVSPERVKELLTNTGFYIDRVETAISLILPILNRMNEELPRIESGPIPSLSTDYAKISGLEEFITTALNEIDKNVPQELQGSEIFIESFNHLGQFSQYIPHLTSSTAPSMASYVPSLQQSLSLVTETLDKVMELLPKCREANKTAEDEITFEDESFANWRVACNHMIQLQTINLNFLLAFESVSLEKQTGIQNILKLLEQLSQALLTAQKIDDVFEQMKSISTQTPSLIGIYAFASNNVHDRAFIAGITTQLIHFLSFILEVVNKKVSNEVIETIKKLPGFINDPEAGKASALEAAKSLLAKYNEYVNLDYISHQKEAISIEKSLKKVVEDENSDVNALANVAVTAGRFVGTALLTAEYSTAVLDTVNETILEILNTHLVNLKTNSLDIEKTFTEQLEIFNEGMLGQVNYHLQTINNAKPFNQSDNDCMKNVASVFASTITLPEVVMKLASVCDEEMTERFQKIADDIEECSKIYSKWYDQLVSGSCTAIQNNAQAITSSLVITFQGQTNLAEDVTSVINEAIKLSDSLQQEPLFIANNVENATALLSSVQKYQSVIKSDDGPENMKLCNKIIKCINESSPKLTAQIADIFVPNNSTDFIALSTAIIKRALPMILSVQDNVDESISSSFLNIFNATTSLCAILNNAPNEFGDLKQFPASINTSLGVIWPLVTNFDQANAQSAQNYILSLSQLLTEFESAVESLPPPFIEVDIPQELRVYRSLEAASSSLPSSALRINATCILDAFKEMKTPNVIEYISKWFEFAHEKNEGISAASNELKAQAVDSSELNTILARVSMAATKEMENSTGKAFEFTESKINEITKLLQKFYATPSESVLNLVKANYNSISLLDKITNIHEDKKVESLQILVSNANIKLDKIRKGDKASTLDCIFALKSLDAYAFFNNEEVYNEYHETISNLCNEITEENIENVNEFILKLSSILKKLNPDKFQELTALTDPNIVCDCAYDRSESFREYTNTILKAAKQHTVGPEVISNVLSQMSTLAYESATITLQSMINEGLTKTSAIKAYAESTNEIFAALKDFEALARSLPTLAEGVDVTQQLRKLSRTMAKRIDGFINYVETPPHLEQASDFEEKRTQFIFALSEASLQCGRVIARLDAAPVNEIIEPEKEELSKALAEKTELLQAAYDAILASAVGPEIDDFTESYKNYMGKLEQAKELIKGAEPTEAKEHAREACVLAQQVIAKVSLLNDHIIILPDPIAAGKLPDEFTLPPLPTEAPAPTEAFEALQKVAKEFQEEMDKTKAKCAEGQNEEIVAQTIALHESAFKFASSCSTMAVATIDSRMQVEQQTLIHSYANAVNQVVEAIRSQIMVVPNAQAELADGMSSLQSITTQLVQLADTASKVQPQQEEEPEANDEVTAELRATASAIEEMSARLAEFGTQFGDSAKEAEINEDDDDEEEDGEKKETTEVTPAEPNDFPSYVISQAQPILRAAGQILKRATEITRDLIAQYGYLSNERMLISLAQELSDDAGLILMCAEMLIKGDAGEDPEFKVIAAAKIVKATVSQLVAQVLVQGGDPEGIMNQHVKTVRICSNHIVRNAEAIVRDRVTKLEAKKKKTGNKMVQKLNAQTVVNEKRKELQENEQAVYKFRKQTAKK